MEKKENEEKPSLDFFFQHIFGLITGIRKVSRLLLPPVSTLAHTHNIRNNAIKYQVEN